MVATINSRPIGPVGPKIDLFTNRTPSKKNVNTSLLVNNKNLTVKNRNRNLSSRRIYPTIVKTSLPKPEFATLAHGNRRNNNRRTLKLIPAPVGPMKVHKTANFVFPEASIATLKKTNRPAMVANFKYVIPNNAEKKIVTLDVEQATPVKVTQFTVTNNPNKRRGRFGSNKVGVASRRLVGGRKHRTMKRRHSHRRRRA